MKTFLLAVAAGLFLTGCGDDPTPKQPAKNDTGNPLTAPVDYLGAVAQAKNHSEKVIDVSYLNQAIQLFNASEGRFPKTLDELVPNYVGKLPETPFGTKLDYDATAGTVKVVKQ
jgi:hypothetical protein